MAMNQQLSLRVPDALRAAIRTMLEDLRRRSPEPDKVTEADAVRELLKAGAKAEGKINE
jgi:hypothetical protein